MTKLQSFIHKLLIHMILDSKLFKESMPWIPYLRVRPTCFSSFYILTFYLVYFFNIFLDLWACQVSCPDQLSYQI